MNKQELIEKYIRDLISNHALCEGDKVFSIREMAKMQHCSVTPVVSAYQHLEMLGVLRSRPKSGFYVSEKLPYGNGLSSPEHSALFDVESDEQSRLRKRVSLLVHDPSIIYPYAPAQLAPCLTDYAKISHFISKSLAHFPNHEKLCYTNDDPDMAAATSKWMERCKLQVPPSELCFTTGIVPSLVYALQSCVSRGDAVAIESPGNSHFYFAAKLYGVEIVPIQSDPRTGLDLDRFEHEAERNPRIRCIICAPNFSVPTGALMPLAEKQRLAEFCQSHDIIIIEDDTANDLSHKILPPMPIKSISQAQVIYISGFENDLSPIYYISGGKYHQRIRGFAELSQAYVPKVLQQAYAMYLHSGYAAKHIKYVRRQVSEAVCTAHKTVMEHFPPGTTSHCPKGGRFLWVEMPLACNSTKLLDIAEDLGISFAPGSIFSADGAFTNCLRLNCSVIADDPCLVDGIAQLGQAAGLLLPPSP